MTISLASERIATGEITETVVLDGGLFFEPRPVVAQACRFADDRVDVVVTLPLEHLDHPRLTGVTRMILEAAVESGLRDALHAAGYTNIGRRAVPGVLVLDAQA